MARYRVTQKVYLNDSFTLVSTQGDPYNNGVLVDLPVNPNKASLFCCEVEAGSIVEVSDDLIPGPAYEAVDAAAKAKTEAYPEAYRPKFHNTLDALPKTLITDGQQAAMDAAEVKQNIGVLTNAIAALMQAQAKNDSGEAPRLKLGGK